MMMRRAVAPVTCTHERPRGPPYSGGQPRDPQSLERLRTKGRTAVDQYTRPTLRRMLMHLALAALMLLASAAAAYAAVNHRPFANPDVYSSQEDMLFSAPRASGVLMNDRDRDGYRLIAKLNRATDHG